jgi:hypothetical protein
MFLLPLLAGLSAVSAKSIHVDCSATGTGDGSQLQPYTSLVTVNNATLQPRDSLLFKSGVNCTGQLKPQGSGTKKQPINISRYRDGTLPVINTEGLFNTTIYLLNLDH